MAIDPTTAAQTPVVPPQANSATPQNPTASLGKADFMKLLVAQLKNQDPLNPMDSRDMIAQLATLTSVEKLTSVDTSLTQLRSETTGMAGMQATSLIGRTVTADANHVTITGGVPSEGTFTLDGAAQSVTIAVRDSSGKMIRTLQVSNQQAGTHTFDWDGTADDGTRVADGSYSFELSAKAAGGQPVPISSSVSGVVSEVSFKSGNAELLIGNSRVALGDVVSIVQ